MKRCKLKKKKKKKMKIVEFANSSDRNKAALPKEPPHLDLHFLPSSL